jgi:hypothetical protein
MSRSFGSFFLYITQNLSTAVQDAEVLEALHTNLRWSLSLRGSARDCAFLQNAFPLSGRIRKPGLNPYSSSEFYSIPEERAQLMSGVAHLPDRTGWLWLKSLTGEAMKIRTRALALPPEAAFRETVARLRGSHRIGHRMRRAEYISEIEQREAGMNGEPPLADRLRQAYDGEAP